MRLIAGIICIIWNPILPVWNVLFPGKLRLKIKNPERFEFYLLKTLNKEKERKIHFSELISLEYNGN